MYNRLLLEKSNTYTQVNNFKVQGTPYLFGGKRPGTIFTQNTLTDSYISYDTYAEVVKYGNTAEGTVMTPLTAIDSFTLLRNAELQVESDIFFIDGRFLNAKEKGYYQRLYAGARFSLFKKYKTDLGIVSTNYVQSDLREFQLSYEYFYYDLKAKELKKLKPNLAFINKQFKLYGNFDEIVSNDDFRYYEQNALIKVFEKLNK
jgi:hypothetical protein